MAIEAVKIPQNVDIEDRIIGAITLRHVFMLLIGGGASYMSWAMLRAMGIMGFWGVIISLFPITVSIIFGFVKVQGVTFFRFCLLMIEKAKKPQRRTWQMRKGIHLTPRKLVPNRKEVTVHHQKKEEVDAIEQLSSVLDSGPLAQGSGSGSGTALDNEEAVESPPPDERSDQDTTEEEVRARQAVPDTEEPGPGPDSSKTTDPQTS